MSIITALWILPLPVLNLLQFSVHPFTPSPSLSLSLASPSFLKCFTAHSSLNVNPSFPLQMLLGCTLCSSCPRSVLYISFLFASGEQSPSLLLVPGPSRRSNQSPGISSGPTLAGGHNADKNTIVIIEAAAMLQLWQGSAAPLGAWDLDGLLLRRGTVR